MTNTWRIVQDGTSMYRPKGKTWPCVELSGSKIFARDNNGKRPSETLITEDISVDGVKALLKRGISLPHPTDEMIEQFVTVAKKDCSRFFPVSNSWYFSSINQQIP